MLEQKGSWTQELDISGTVWASHGDSLVEGRISRGHVVAVYTAVGLETLETPLGPQEAVRVEQQLDFDMEISFDLEGQTIPATETVNLNTTYWFVRDVGLVKTHWQGGNIQYTLRMSDSPIDQQSSVPALAEDQLVFVCVTLTNGSEQCASLAGLSQANLTVPSQSELVWPGLVLPIAEAGVGSAGVPAASGDQAPGEPAGDAAQDVEDNSALLAYAATVTSLGEQLAEDALAFWESALAYQVGQLTFDQFRSEFFGFAAEVEGPIRQINQLSPPPEAATIHQDLTAGLAKCDQAMGLMDDWFDNSSSDTEDAAALLVAECIEEVTQAGEELSALTGEDYQGPLP
jgi:hypothetical protein